MLTQKDLQTAIYEREEKLKDEDIFLSKSYEHRLTEMGNGITNCKLKGTTHMIKGSDSLAYTDGKNTYICYDSEQAASLERVKKHHYFLGLNLHENGHKLFTDFALWKKALENFNDRTLYPMPKDNEYRLETLEYLSDTKTDINALSNIYHNLWNNIEDGFIDRASCAEAPGYAPMLTFVNEVDAIGDIVSIKDMRKMGNDEATIFANMILIYCVHGVRNYNKNEIVDIKDLSLVDSFEKVLGPLTNALYEVRPMERLRTVNEVFCHLIHFLIEEEKKDEEDKKDDDKSESEPSEKNDSSENKENDSEEQNKEDELEDPEKPQESSEEGDKTPDNTSRNNLLESLSNQMQTSERNTHENMESPDKEAINSIRSSMKDRKEESGNSEFSSSAESIEECDESSELNQIMEDIATEALCQEQESEIKGKMKAEVSEYMTNLPYHGTIHSKIVRTEPNERALDEYEEYHGELDEIVRKLTRTFEKEIKDRQIGDTMNSLYAGKRLDNNHLYAHDKRIFSRKILPEDIPDLGVGILVDCSGSMCWGEPETKIMVAKKCAYITYQFCKKLNIPCFVIGHTTDDDDVVLISVADENSLDGNDKLRIFSLDAEDSNRDGYALRYCLKKLENMTTKDKMMMVISDGRPAHNGYGMREGTIDCQGAVHDAIKKGIFTIAAGLGTDAESVRRVYQEGRSEKDSAAFLDLSDLERMPTAFVKIIKKKLESA